MDDPPFGGPRQAIVNRESDAVRRRRRRQDLVNADPIERAQRVEQVARTRRRIAARAVRLTRNLNVYEIGAQHGDIFLGREHTEPNAGEPARPDLDREIAAYARGIALDERQPGARRVVAKELPWRHLCLRRVSAPRYRTDRGHHGTERLERNATRPPDERRRHRDVEHRGLDADVARSGVEHEIHTAIEVAEHVRGARRARPRELIRAWRRDGHARRGDHGARHGMCWHAHGDRRQAGGHGIGHNRPFRQDHRQRSRPEVRAQHPSQRWNVAHDRVELIEAGDVDNERVRRGTPLGRENRGDGHGIQGIGAESVHGLGWQDDQPTRPQARSRLRDHRGVGMLAVHRQHTGVTLGHTPLWIVATPRDAQVTLHYDADIHAPTVRPPAMIEEFRPGQRYVSVTEPELGLGDVRTVTARRVTVAFPASGDTREYARQDAPLRRAIFRAGDTVMTADRREHRVDAVREENGLLHYVCAGVTVPETALHHTLSFSNPLTRLSAGSVDSSDVFALRQRALGHQHAARRSAVRGFLGGRIDLLPHQLSIATEVAGRLLPRVLLADEVGLGKTIEAGLIVHRLIATGRVSRALVLVPSSLVHQWFVELLRRFNLWFSIYDESRCAAIQDARPDANPFLDSQLVLCDLALMTHTPLRLEQAVAAGWDALVVDEAHHLGWTPEATSSEYAAVEAISRVTPRLLLLTATPEQLGVASHFARLRLLDPDRFCSLEDFTRESAGYRDIARIADALQAAAPLDAGARTTLAALLGESAETVDATLTAIAAGDAAAARAWVDALLDRHGTGRVMFRNTRATVSGFPERLPHLYPLALTADGPDGARALHREWLGDVEGQLEGRQPNLRTDPRVVWLVGLLRRLDSGDKVLLLCRSPQKALAVETAVRAHSATLAMAAFHEGLTLVQRDRAAAWFAEPDGARLLICSEIGSEGRNFQCAHHLVLFDLPLDPAVLDQRIGRLDRIGQTSAIHVHVPYVPGTHLEVLARWYHEGLDAFSRHLPGGRELLDRFGVRVSALAGQIHDRRHASAPALAALIDDTRAERDQVAAQLEAGRDRLLEWNSFRPHVAAHLIDEIERHDADLSLDDFLLAVLDLFVIDVEEIAPRTYRLGSAGVLTDEFPGLPADGMTLTANRRRALAREDLQFLTWDHPLVNGALDLLLGSEKGNSAFLHWPATSASGLYLEAIYVLECLAPPGYHVDRFLPPTPIRIVVDARGESAPAEAAVPPPSAGAAPRQAAAVRALLSSSDVRDRLLPTMIAGAKALADAHVGAIADGARDTMHAQLDAEIGRLRALQAVNRSVREAEIDALVEQRHALDSVIGAARVRLDAVRLILRGPGR